MKLVVTLFTILLTYCAAVPAYEVIGLQPPSTHTAEPGIYTPYDSAGGARRYLEIFDETKCDIEPELVSPSSTYTIAKGGLFKYYQSRTGVRKPWPVSFAEECAVPESPDTDNPPPPPQEVNFVGLHRVSINPIVGEHRSACTFAEFEVYAKTLDGKYLFRFKRVYDASISVNGVASCPYDME